MELHALLVIEGCLDFDIDSDYIIPGVPFNAFSLKTVQMLVRMISFFLSWNFVCMLLIKLSTFSLTNVTNILNDGCFQRGEWSIFCSCSSRSVCYCVTPNTPPPAGLACQLQRFQHSACPRVNGTYSRVSINTPPFSSKWEKCERVATCTCALWLPSAPGSFTGHFN